MSCLFDSVAALAGGTGAGLRAATCDFLASNSDRLHNGATFREWVEWQGGLPFRAYVSNMRRPETWGGATEASVLAILLRSDVVILRPMTPATTSHGRASARERVLAEAVWDDTTSSRARLFVTWDGSHYEPEKAQLR